MSRPAARPASCRNGRLTPSPPGWPGRPGAELICRDRAGCYSEGGARGAPEAIQVADRWHLWHNLGDAVERAVARHRQHLAAAVAEQAAEGAAAADTPQTAAPRAQRGDQIAVRTRGRHADVRRLLDAGRSVSAIAAELGLSRNTVRRFARAADPEELLARDGTGRRTSILQDYEPYLRERWNSGCTNAAQLWRELRARGYPGSCRGVRGYLTRFRGTTRMPAPPAKLPKTRTVTTWIMTRPDNLSTEDQARLDTILASSAELAAVTAHVRAFGALMTGRRGRDLEQWMTSAAATAEPSPVLRHRPARRPRRRHRRTNPPVELRQRGRTRQPHQNAQTPDVRTREPRPAPPPHSASRLTSRKLCQNQDSSAVDRCLVSAPSSRNRCASQADSASSILVTRSTKSQLTRCF